MKLLPLLASAAASFVDNNGRFHFLNPDTAGIGCIGINVRQQIYFEDCDAVDFTQWQIQDLDDGTFQVVLSNNHYTNIELCFQSDNEFISAKLCANKDNQKFFYDDSTYQIRSTLSPELCMMPWANSIRTMPCNALNTKYRGVQFYDFESVEDMRENAELLSSLINPSPVSNPLIANLITELKAQNHGYILIARKESFAFSESDIDFSGLYRWHTASRSFQNSEDTAKLIRINTITKQFEIAIDNVPNNVAMISGNKRTTEFKADYFENHEIVDIFFKQSWCASFDPCGDPLQAQCHDKKFGFSCSCSPHSQLFGPLCDQQTPCAEAPCQNNGACKNVFFPNGTTTFECDCSTSPGEFSGPTCNDCASGQGKGVNGVCVRYNECLSEIEYCSQCDNDLNPTQCLSCEGDRYVDSLSGDCAENVCSCSNGTPGACPINNRFNCDTCDLGFLHIIDGENRKCDPCPANTETNYAGDSCVPCLRNFANPVPGGYCEECPSNHVREVNEDHCTVCSEHLHRPYISSSCVPCPSSTPRRWQNDLNEDEVCMAVTCPTGQHANVETNFYCTQNDCTCSGGYAATGDSCLVNDEERCASCYSGHALINNECISCDSPNVLIDDFTCRTCNTNEYYLRNPYGDLSCVAQCPDENQYYATESGLPRPICTDCPNGEEPTSDRTACWAGLVCTCENGTPATGEACPYNGEYCVACADRFVLNSNNGCDFGWPAWPENDGGNCYMPTGTTDTRHFGMIGMHSLSQGTYVNNLRCTYILAPSHGLEWRYKFTFFDIEDNSSCNYDYMTVTSSSSFGTSDKKCGTSWGYSRAPPENTWVTVPAGESRYINVGTDGSVVDRGFRLVFEPVGASTCLDSGTCRQCPGGEEAISSSSDSTYSWMIEDRPVCPGGDEEENSADGCFSDTPSSSATAITFSNARFAGLNADGSENTSTRNTGYSAYPPSKLNDGRYGESMAHSSNANKHIFVDFSTSRLSQVKIIARSGCCWGRYIQVTVHYKKLDGTYVECPADREYTGTYVHQLASKELTYTCDGACSADGLKIVQASSEPNQISELYVNGWGV